MREWSKDDAKAVLSEHYGIIADVTRLPGEWGGTFRVDTSTGKRYLIKFAPEDTDPNQIDLEHMAIANVAAMCPQLNVPVVVPNQSGNEVTRDCNGVIRVFRWVEGRPLAEVNPWSHALMGSLGTALGNMKQVLKDLAVPLNQWSCEWAPHEVEWVGNHFGLFTGEEQEIIRPMYATAMEQLQLWQDHLMLAVNYNDANDYNIIVSSDPFDPKITGFIDFGDVHYGPSVNDLAICLAYAMMGTRAPLDAGFTVVQAFHTVSPLTEPEMAVLFPLATARLLISVTKSRLRYNDDPENTYWQISSEPAWELLRALRCVPRHLAHCIFRSACGLVPDPASADIRSYLRADRKTLYPVLGYPVESQDVLVFDWSVGSAETGHPETSGEIAETTRRMFETISASGARLGLGRYNEPRLVYTSQAYLVPGLDIDRARTIHLGIDIFLPAGTPLYAPLDGTVVTIADNGRPKEYGPFLILRHQISDTLYFYTIYGHLSTGTLDLWKQGNNVKRGEKIGAIGNFPENGDWVPHLHFQIATDLLNYEDDFPGVGDPKFRDVWLSISPDPNLIFGIPRNDTSYEPDFVNDLVSRRKSALGPGLSLSYSPPLHMVRGWKTTLYDANGGSWLDTRNNVAHVGHEHPEIVEAGKRQMAVLNTNTRYLSEVRLRCAERLLSTLPDHLRFVYFVNSGSEANDLALRMARAYTENIHTLVLDRAYHGHTQSVLEVSPYKFKGQGGFSAPSNVHILTAPDTYRGQFARSIDGDERLIENATDIVMDLTEQKGGVTFIHESLPGCAGQLVPPRDYFRSIYSVIQNHGGVCIADEVQTGLGRVGSYYWAFELYNIAPDIVTIGKPLGNGHPVAAVAFSEKVALVFDNGMEYFNTFGGNPVSCAIADAVLEVIASEKLQQHAMELGSLWRDSWNDLQQKHPVIGDIRGHGLFLGVEFSLPDKVPATCHAKYFCDRMTEHRILTSLDGPDHNVLKLKPPMCISEDEIDHFMNICEKVLGENAMQIE